VAAEINEQELHEYMRRCILLATQTPKSIGRPHVGALVISACGRIVGEGHKDYISGTQMLIHAERSALDAAGEAAGGGYLVTTLEPCLRANRNQVLQPCCELIKERGIELVIFGLEDGSPHMQAGGGARFLQDHCIRTIPYRRLNHLIAHYLMNTSYQNCRN